MHEFYKLLHISNVCWNVKPSQCNLCLVFTQLCLYFPHIQTAAIALELMENQRKMTFLPTESAQIKIKITDVWPKWCYWHYTIHHTSGGFPGKMLAQNEYLKILLCIQHKQSSSSPLHNLSFMLTMGKLTQCTHWCFNCWPPLSILMQHVSKHGIS